MRQSYRNRDFAIFHPPVLPRLRVLQHRFGQTALQIFFLQRRFGQTVGPLLQSDPPLRAERAAHVELTATGRFRVADLWAAAAAG